MGFIKTITLAFSMYSQIPMPILNYEEKDMRYTFLAFPLVGVVIGLLELGWFYLAGFLTIGVLLKAAIATAIPIVITGGFHMDGFMDTTDALCSHREREKKLEILKDSHVGAFAVIWSGLYFITFFAAMTEMVSALQIELFAICFVMSRASSGLAAISFSGCEGHHSLAYYVKAGAKKNVRIGLVIWMMGMAFLACMLSAVGGVLISATMFVCYVYYYRMSNKQFGGISGDLAGWYLQFVELAFLLVLAIGKVAL